MTTEAQTETQTENKAEASKETRMTDITMILDRSGSMEQRKHQAIESFNSFLHEQQGVAGRARMSLVQFDHEYERLYSGLKLKKASMLDETTYEPRGRTALRDAIGTTIIATARRLEGRAAKRKKAGKPEMPTDVVIAIITDGLENASQEFTSKQIRKMIHTCEEVDEWSFIFMGTSKESVTHGVDIGVDEKRAFAMGESPREYAQAQGMFSGKVSNMRRSGMKEHLDFTPEEREEARRRSNS